ncbi:MAG: DUF1349 domain-containing protein [Caldilinea sp. CFX5]|nr:DUF1349 domain-containing protein [Caldilinea sp. CFX5]
MAQLALQVLGMPRIQVDGAAVHIVRRRVLACAVYLAVTGRAQSRDTLATLFWPEETQQNARADLRRTLHLLHRTFGEDRLLVEHEAVRLIHDQNLWLDIDHFHRLLAVCRSHGHAAAEVCPACLPPLAAAAALYRDDFLAGFTLPDSPDFDQWQFQQGEALRADLASALEHLVRGYTAQQAWEQAIAYARRWLALDPLHEPVQRWLMQLYAWSGQQSAALRQYRDAVHLLEQELGVPPAAETQQLQWQIKRHRLPPPTVDQLRCAPAPTEHREAPPAAAVPAPTEDEVRLLTVVCAGLRPVPVEEEDLEQEAAAVTQLFTLATTACAPYSGQVERVPGGDLLLTFGRDQIHEDDPERAVRAALALQAAALAANLPIQIGVNTGLVYCTPGDAAATNAGTVMGAVVNLAAQLRSRAAVGQLLVGKATDHATRGSFVTTPLSLTLTGATAPVTVYHLHGLHSRPAKSRGIEGLPHTLVGRTAELARLHTAFAQVQTGVGHLVLINGAAGVGKSRLVSELQKQWRVAGSEWRVGGADLYPPPTTHHPPPLWLEGRCLAFAMTASYALFVDALRGYLSEEESGGEAGLAARLVALLQTLTNQGDLTPVQVAEMGPLLGRLLSLHFGTAWDERLQTVNPEQVRSQTFLAVETLLTALARQQPVVLVCEDLHWADALSLALLARLIERLPQLPLLLVCVYRPEGAQAGEPLAALAAQKEGAHSTVIALGELPVAQSRQLLTTLLAGAELPPPARDLIVSTAQGNPFFLEEIVRALMERGLLYRDDHGWQAAPALDAVTAPATVQQVILSRIDQLAPAQKRLLQNAAVVGRLFRPRVLAALLPAAKLDQALAELTDQAFIYQERSLPEPEYSFRHVLMQDAIYHALPGRRRARLHQSVAEALEACYADDLTAYVEQLAYHYEQSPASLQTVRKAIAFMLRAGSKAQRAFLPTAALGYYERALARLTDSSAIPERESWLLETYHGLAYTYLELSDFAAAARYERQAIAQAQAMALPPREQARYYGWIGRFLRARGELDELIRTCEAGLAILGDDQQCWEAAILKGNIADAYNIKSDRRQFRAIMEHTISFLPHVPCTTGAICVTYGHAVTLCLERKAIAEASAWLRLMEQGLRANYDLSPLTWAYMWVAASLYEALGDTQSLHAQYQIALDLCRQTGITYDRAWALMKIAHYHFAQGELDQAEAAIREAYAYRAQVGLHGELVDNTELLARIAYCRGEIQLAMAQIEETLALVEQSGFAYARASQQTLLGQLYLVQGQPQRALALFQRAIAAEQPDAKGMPTLVAALAGIEAALADPAAFQAYCRQVQVQQPDLHLQQWWLEPTEADFGLSETSPTTLKSPDWVDPFGDCRWAVAEQGIIIQAANRRDLWVNNLSAPRLLHPVAGDFAVQVVCCAAEADRPAIGGLLLWHDQENYVRLTWGEYGAAAVTLAGCIANSDQMLGRGRLSHTGQVYLRLERRGPQVRALCSADGQAWFCAGQVALPSVEELSVGLHAIGKIDRTFYPGAYPAGTAICFTGGGDHESIDRAGDRDARISAGDLCAPAVCQNDH